MRARKAASVVLLGLTASLPSVGVARADKRTHPDERARLATDVVVGAVTDSYTKDAVTDRMGEGTTERRFLFEIRIDAVERGATEPGDLLYVRAWRVVGYPGDAPKIGTSGHAPLPKVGDRVRVFAMKGPYPEGGQTDSGFTAVYENGFVILPADAAR
jgi:hypothetical protein